MHWKLMTGSVGNEMRYGLHDETTNIEQKYCKDSVTGSEAVGGFSMLK